MPAANIEIGGVPGSNIDWTINTLVQLSNADTGGELTYLWAISDQPEGTTDSLSSTTIENPTFTPQKEGTYRISLTVNFGLATEVTSSVVLAVRQIKTDNRIPAAGETTEADLSRGWAQDVGAMLLGFDDLVARGPTIVCQAAASQSVGTVCYISTYATLKSGLPGEEIVPVAAAALANDTDKIKGGLMLCLGHVDGSTTVGLGAMGRYLLFGVYQHGSALGGAGSDVFVSDTGTLSATRGTNRRVVGQVLATGGGQPILRLTGLMRRSQVVPFVFAVSSSTNTPSTSFMFSVNSQSSATPGTNYEIPVPEAGRVIGFQVSIEGNAHDDTLTFKLYKNGVATALVATATAGVAAAGIMTDTGGLSAISFAAGDSLVMGWDTPAGITVAATRITCTVWYELV